MEGVGEEWESLNRMIFIEDSVDLPLMINANYNDEIPSSNFSWPNNHDDQSLYNFSSFSDILVSSTTNTDIFNGNGNYHDTYCGYGHNATDYSTLNVDDQFMDNNLLVPDLQVYDDDQLCIMINDQMQLTRKYNETVPDDETNHLSQSPKKRSRVSKEKNKRKAESTTKKKKTTSMINKEQAENNSSHEDELNGSEGSPSESKDELVSNTPNSKLGKRGSATDPQSLYARRRREKINERLKILQNLVPNGTKVDISTMLEEAVHYVKFLQLQIKLLSSDDLWMYAPIAHMYSGMDMGLYQKIFSNLPC